MSDCVYFQTIIKELNPADSNSGDCCTWSMVECDNNGSITKIDLSNYNGVTAVGPFPQTIAFLTHLKEFSIRGQQNINDIYSLNTENLEKIDLSNSGMNSANFPSWIYDAPNLKEIDISNTQMTGLPQRELKSNLNGCNFSNTPICGSYEGSPYNFIPEICKSSCTNGGASGNFSNNSSSGSSGNSNGGTKIWPFILIGAGVLILLGVIGLFLFSKKGKKTSYKDYEDNDPKPILPVSKKEEKKETKVQEEEEPFEITIKNDTPAVVTKPQISPFVSSGPPTPASDLNNEKIEEVAINNYTNAYGGDAKAFNENRTSGNYAKDIYRQHNDPNMSYEQDNIQTHPSIYNTMTTDNDSDDDDDNEQVGNIINQPIADAVNQEKIPTLLRRKSSRKQNIKTEVEEETYEPVQSEPEVEYELYIANWDYTPTLSDELALVAGDVIEINKMFDDGWCNGYNRRTNKSGIVPLCYLKEYED